MQSLKVSDVVCGASASAATPRYHLLAQVFGDPDLRTASDQLRLSAMDAIAEITSKLPGWARVICNAYGDDDDVIEIIVDCLTTKRRLVIQCREESFRISQVSLEGVSRTGWSRRPYSLGDAIGWLTAGITLC